MKIKELLETASVGATSTAGITSSFAPKKGKNVGSLFGGSYGESSKPVKTKVKMLKRANHEI